jgi:hypothetical protein
MLGSQAIVLAGVEGSEDGGLAECDVKLSGAQKIVDLCALVAASDAVGVE